MGSLEVIYGPMFSGKTQLLIERLRVAGALGADVVAFKPAIDDRAEAEIVSLSGARYPAISVIEAADLVLATEPPAVVGVDEAQFFDDALGDVIHQLRTDGRLVYVAGLDLDFRGRPFGPMPRIIRTADRTVALTAECAVCTRPATRTQRLVCGRPASMAAPTVVVGGREMYEPRCVAHHIV